jgi:hypothetical protein
MNRAHSWTGLVSKSTLIFLMIAGGFTVGGCYSYEQGTYFPENYRQTYTQVTPCRVSEEHSSPYYLMHVNKEAVDMFKKSGQPYAPGTVMVKGQFDDKECNNLQRWTVMRRHKTGWHWQNVKKNGKIAEQGKVAYCMDCHENCDNDLVCTKP